MVKEKTKIVTIDERQYQIGRFSPEVGSFIALNILATIVKAQNGTQPTEEELQQGSKEAEKRDSQETVKGMIFAAYLSGLTFDLHCSIQKHCLQVCSRMEGNPGQELLPMPLAKLPDVLADMPLVMRLETETLAFNLADFFAGGGLKAMTGNPQPSHNKAVSQKA